MAADGRIIIETNVDTKKVSKAADEIKGKLGGVEKAASKMGKALAVAFAVKKVIDFGLACAELGSNLAEVENVTSTVFPNMTAQLDAFTQAAAESAGLSETMAKRYIGTFGAMASSFGYSEGAAYEMSKTLTQLTGDVASFYNISQDEAFNKLKSVFTGETEALKGLGVVMTQTALNEYALANGFGKTIDQMSEGEKVALRYQFVLNQLSKASGDFAKTSDSWANQMRLFSLYLDQIKTNLGTAFINLFKPILMALNKVLQAVNVVAKAFAKLTEIITGKQSKQEATLPIDTGLGDLYDDAASGADDYAAATNKAAKANEKAAKAAKAYESPLDQINKYQEQAADSTAKTAANTGAANALKGLGNVDFGGLPAAGDAIDTLGEKVKAFYEKAKTYLEPVITAFNRVKEALKPLGQKIVSGWAWIWENILKPIGGFVITNVIPVFFNAFAAALNILNGVLDILKPIWLWFWDTVIKPIANFVGDAFVTFWSAVNGAIGTFADWCKNIPKHFETMKKFIVDGAKAAKDKFVAAFKAMWDGAGKFVNKIMTMVTTGFTNVKTAIATKLNEAWTAVKTTFTNIWNTAKTIVGNTVSSVVGAFTTLKNNVGTIFNNVKTSVVNVWDAISKKVSGVISTIAEKASGMKTTIQNAFKNAFENAMKFIKTPINGIIGFINGLIRGVVSGINAMLNAINRIHVSIPSWIPGVGGNRVGFNIPTIVSYPQIPYLAKGAVIPPNAPFLAALGDQKNGRNLEAPESLIRQIVAEESGKGEYRFIAQINRRTLFDEFIKEAQLRKNSTGINPLLLA